MNMLSVNNDEMHFPPAEISLMEEISAINNFLSIYRMYKPNLPVVIFTSLNFDYTFKMPPFLRRELSCVP